MRPDCAMPAGYALSLINVDRVRYDVALACRAIDRVLLVVDRSERSMDFTDSLLFPRRPSVRGH